LKFKNLKKNIGLIKNTSLAKFFSYPANLISFLILVNYFDKFQVSFLLIFEAFVGIIFSGLFSSQNIIANRFFVSSEENSELQGSIFFSSVILKLSFLFISFLILYTTSGLLISFSPVDISSSHLALVLVLIATYSFYTELVGLISLSCIQKKRYILNFIVLVIVPISYLVSILYVKFLTLDLIHFFLLRALLPLVFVVFVTAYFSKGLNLLKFDFNLINLKNNIFKITSLQLPLMASGLFTTTTYSIPLFGFSYIGNIDFVAILGFLDRVFKPFLNGLRSLFNNLLPNFFTKFDKSSEVFEKDLISFSKLFLSFSTVIIPFSIFFYFLYCKSFSVNFSYQELTLFVLRFMVIIPILCQMFCNSIFYSEEKTGIVAKLTIARSSINLFNIFAMNYGLLPVLTVYFLAPALPLFYSLQKVMNFSTFKRLIYYSISVAIFVVLILVFI